MLIASASSKKQKMINAVPGALPSPGPIVIVTPKEIWYIHEKRYGKTTTDICVSALLLEQRTNPSTPITVRHAMTMTHQSRKNGVGIFPLLRFVN